MNAFLQAVVHRARVLGPVSVFVCTLSLLCVGVTARAAEPQLIAVDQVTGQASSSYSANAWGANGNRLVRGRNGDLYTVYIAAGPDSQHFRWVLATRPAAGKRWRTLASGLTAHQPGNPPSVLIDSTGTVYVVAISPWNSAGAGAPEIWDSVTRRTTVIPGHWVTGRTMLRASSMYPAAGIDARGDLYVWENVLCPDFRYPRGGRLRCHNVDVPGTVYWAFRAAGQRAWRSHQWVTRFRYAYDFLLGASAHNLTVVGTRDILQAPYEAPYACPSRNHYCFDQTIVAHWSNVNVGPSSLIVARTANTAPGYRGDHRASAEDAYVDTMGRTHVLVTVDDAATGGRFQNHELVIDPNGHVNDVTYYAVPYPNFSRVLQDPSGQFWVYSVGPSLSDRHRCEVFIASAGPGSSDGTDFGPTTKLALPPRFDCSSETRNYDAAPRSGSGLAYFIDGVLATNGGATWVHYRIALPHGSAGAAVSALPLRSS